MGINIIRGEIGSGKSTRCMEMIKRVHENYPDDKCVMLVPNHYSYETERRFVREFGGTGINNIEVMTLRRLAISLLESASLNHITAAGRHMLIRRAVEEFCAEASGTVTPLLLASMKKPGFTDVMSSLISEFKRYAISAAELAEKAELAESAALREKLIAAARVYGKYNDYITSSDYTDSEDDNERLASRILKGDIFGRRTHIWVDNFDEFTPQQRLVLNAFAAVGASVTISVCHSDTRRIYDRSGNAEQTAFELARRFGMGEIIDTGEGFRGQKRGDIRFLLENWGADNICYAAEPENISLSASRDIYGEVEKAACLITDLVREEGLRYRDIAILCGSTESYNHIIETVFDEYKIPYFTDSTVALSDHPIAMQLLSVFDIFENDWTYESVFRYLKAGFIYSYRREGGRRALLPLNPEDIDELENYVLKYGVIGASRWGSEDDWIDAREARGLLPGNEADGESKRCAADKLRREVAKSLLSLYEKTRGHQNAEHFARAMFEFLCEINLNSGLKTEVRLMRGRGQINEAEQFTKLWNLLLDALNQTVVALTDAEITFEKFGEYLRIGLSQCEIRTIPSGIDQVYVGNVEKCSAAEVKAMLIVGANDGTFPGRIPAEGFFSNADRNAMSVDCGITIAPDTKTTMDRQYFKVYRALCAVTERLFISRPAQSADGHALMPSAMIKDIERIMPLISHTDDSMGDTKNSYMYISTPEATIHRMLINKSARNRFSCDPVWDAVYEWYSEREEWHDLVSLIDRAQWYMSADVRLDAELAERLYEAKTFYSASRLDAFAGCPFGYFMRYGIRAREREIWEITPADVGSYAHDVIKRFCETIEEGAETDAQKAERWRSLDDERREAVLDKITAEAKEAVLSHNARDREKSASILTRTGKNIKNAAKTVHRALSLGKYARRGLELPFELELTENIGIQGIIDRVDETSDDSEIRLRIIDYKTGRTSFDIANIAAGKGLQMVIYALAAQMTRSAPGDGGHENGKDVRVTGIYYNKMHSDMLSMEMGTQKDEAASKGDEQLKLDGVTFARSDEDIYEMDESMRDTKKSGLLNIRYVKKTGRYTGMLRSEREMRGLLRFAKDKIKETDAKIKAGHIECTPYKGRTGSSECAFCIYTQICSFKNMPEENKNTMTDKEAWQIMYELGGDGGDE